MNQRSVPVVQHDLLQLCDTVLETKASDTVRARPGVGLLRILVVSNPPDCPAPATAAPGGSAAPLRGAATSPNASRGEKVIGRDP